MTETYLTNRAQAAADNDVEVWRLLHLIVAEFQSDPASVQCFDLRIVERAKLCISARIAEERSGYLPPILTDGRRPI